jgi:hydrogenase small subunit
MPEEQVASGRRSQRRPCIVKVGCSGPVGLCDVPKRGSMDDIGGCPNVGGICIGCTTPGFPDTFLPFADYPPDAARSTAAVLTYGRTVRALRNYAPTLRMVGK